MHKVTQKFSVLKMFNSWFPFRGSGVKHILLILLLTFATLHTHAQSHDTIRIYFPLDKNNLTEQASKTLDSLMHNKVIEPGKKIILLGWGDYLGSESYNDNLSYARAKNVQDYLVIYGFNKPDITLVLGKGKINRPPLNGNLGFPPDRKVDIIIDSKIDTPAEQKMTHYILRLNEGETYALRNINFYQGSIRITPGSLPELKMLYNFLRDHPTIKIQLEGHICCMGIVEGVDEPYDESTLSQKRAETIADSMFVYGIAKDRIKCIGLGNNNLIRNEEGYEDEARSRRVEVKILSR
jgi:outer membrane protein OmpA-like peptidoglycan-associated protein